jgi:hypothetical protein
LPSEEEVSPQRPIKQQSRAIQARWAGEKASEEEVTVHFQSLPLDKALVLLAKMRSNCTLAGTILNQRINEPLIQRCFTCKKSLEELTREKGSGFRDWKMNRPHRSKTDPNIIQVDHFCSERCIALANQKEQGIRGVADRGMMPADNPKNHPRQVNVDALHKEAI